MDKKYITLFQQLAQATAASAEAVMEYNQSKNDENGLKTATVMRDDFQSLADRLSKEDYIMSKSDSAKLLVGTMIIVNQTRDKITALKKALTGYQTDLVPKLQSIVDEAQNDEDASKMAEEKFIIKEE